MDNFTLRGAPMPPMFRQNFATGSGSQYSLAGVFDLADSELRIGLDGIVHDRVAIQYQLMHDLLNGGPDERYVLFDIDEFKTLIVRNVGERKVSTPAGDFRSVGIQHQAENSSRITTLWCVEELGYLPVLIEQHRKGKLRMRAELRTYAELAI